MSRGWRKSNLVYGESVRIPKELFITAENAVKRLLSASYIGETDTGIMIDCVFKPSIRAIAPEHFHYKVFITWASIWDGSVKVYRSDGEQVHAYRQKGLPLAIGQYR